MPRFSGRVFKKRIPTSFGNRKCSEKMKEAANRSSSVGTTTSDLESDTGIESDHNKTSALKRKLSLDYDLYNNVNSGKINQIIDLDILSSVLHDYVLCKNCKKSGVRLVMSHQRGLAAQLLLQCDNCDFKHSFYNSQQIDVELEGKGKTKLFEINIRFCYALRSIGKGKLGGQTLCGIMNLPGLVEKDEFYYKALGNAVKKVAEISMQEAVEEAVNEHQIVSGTNDRRIPASFDGSWQKRGHQSKNGVITTLSVDNGKVLDVSIVTKYCSCLDKENHALSCTQNYVESSGGMEVAGVLEIFRRSIDKHNVIYDKYLGDGDSRSHQAVCVANVYYDIEVEKLECVGLIQKRMGARLQKLKQTMKRQKLDDGGLLGGKNRLTDGVIDQLQSYYGMAIRGKTSVEDMRRAIWAIYFHKMSTDDTPCHGLCPTGPDLWCKFKKQELGIIKEYKHKNSLPGSVMSAIKPIFKDLSQPSLLKKWLHGKTQNTNESFNNVIWTRIPKNVFVKLHTRSLGVFDAVGVFNDGNIVKCRVLEKLGLNPGFFTVKCMQQLDLERIRDSERKISDFEREARRKRRTMKRLQEDQEEGQADYEYGMF